MVEEADLLLLNKLDLVLAGDLDGLEARLRAVNPAMPVLRTQRCTVDLDLLFGLARARETTRRQHRHQPEYDSFTFISDATFDRASFEVIAANLVPAVYRAKDFVRFADGCLLFNFVNGRWDFEPFDSARTELVFIGALTRLPGELRGRVGGMPDRLFRLQCSTDLDAWTDLGTFTNTPALTLSLPVAPDEPRRFYRIVAP